MTPFTCINVSKCDNNKYINLIMAEVMSSITEKKQAYEKENVFVLEF